MIKRIVFVAAAFYDVMRIFFFFHKFTLERKEHLFYNENTEQMFVQVTTKLLSTRQWHLYISSTAIDNWKNQ